MGALKQKWSKIKMGTDFFYVTTIVAAIVVGIIGYALYKLRMKHPDRSLGDTINYIFLSDTTTFAVVSLIAVNVFEGIMAASIPSRPGEVDIQPIARFGGHLFISLIAIAFGLASIGALVKLKHVKGWGNRAEVGFIALVCFAAAMYIPYLNILLIAQGLGQLDQLAYVTRFNLTGFKYMTYPMASSTIMWVLHYILMIADAALSFKVGKHVVLSIFTSSKNIEKTKEELNKDITEKGEKAAKKEAEQPDNLIETIGKRYRIGNKQEEADFIKDAIAKKDLLSPPLAAKLGSNLVKLHREIQALDATKKSHHTEEERQVINSKVFSKIADFWQRSAKDGNGFGRQLPVKKHKKEGEGN